jgi:integrase
MSPKPLPPHLHHEVDRHGNRFWTIRRGHGRRIRIRAEFNSVEFWSEYETGVKALDRPRQRQGFAAGTFAAALRDYRTSNAWLSLSVGTRGQRSYVLANIEKKLGHSLLRQWRTADIAAGRDARTPTMARQYLATLRGLFQWAVENGHLKQDPTAGLKVKVPKSPGHATWSDADVERYRARWPFGTPARLALELLRETGLRRGDAVRVGPSNIIDGVLRVVTEKTGEPVSIAVSDTLAKAIEAGPTGETFVIGAFGRPLNKHTFGKLFTTWTSAAGLTKRTAHGLRKTAATALAHDGWSEAELDARFGWRGMKQAAHYTKSANRERLSLGASARTNPSRTQENSVPDREENEGS